MYQYSTSRTKNKQRFIFIKALIIRMIITYEWMNFHLADRSNRISSNHDSLMLGMSCCHVFSQGFSPNSHHFTFHPTQEDVSKTEELPVFPPQLLFIDLQTLRGHSVGAPMDCLLSCSHATNITASYHLQEIEPLCCSFPGVFLLPVQRGSP